MRGNHYSSHYGITTFGESHGSAIGVVIEDVKPGIQFPLEEIKTALAQRRSSGLATSTSRIEPDEIEIISGVLNGVTTGMPICILVRNKNADSSDYETIKDIFRPGHGDFSIFNKFKIYDWRGGGRISGRETICRVIAGETVNHLFKGVEFIVETFLIGSMTPKYRDTLFAKENPYYWTDPSTLSTLKDYLEQVKTEGNSVGGVIQITIRNLPAGWGDPVFEKLDANIAKAVLSVGAVKGIEFGEGFSLSAMKGIDSNDEMNSEGFVTNKAGGILAGVSTGEDIVMRIAVKPVPSVSIPQKTVDINGNEKIISIKGRHDVCLIPRIVPVLLSMLKLSLADAGAYQKLITESERSLADFREYLDKVDEDLLISLRNRFNIVKDIIRFKENNAIPLTDKVREVELINNLKAKAELLGISTELVQSLWQSIIAEGKMQK
ncbi:MAG: chorismate synthase [Candidatus Cloacimonetes bacterium]|nr:chorismate synthase [Candidatus Cloacimonadota bacterium]